MLVNHSSKLSSSRAGESVARKLEVKVTGGHHEAVFRLLAKDRFLAIGAAKPLSLGYAAQPVTIAR